MLDLGTAVGYLMLDSSGFTGGFTSANKSMKTFFDSSSSVQDRVKGLGSAFDSVGGTLTKSVTLPLIGAGTAAVGFASSAEDAFSKFSSSVGELTRGTEYYRDVMEDIYKNNYGDSYEDVADSMALIVKNLDVMDPSKLQEVTESAFALRDTMGYDVAESIRTVDTLMKNFGLTTDQAFDYIVKGNQEGLDYSNEFLDTINEYSVQFQKLGLDANDMFNILKQGADSGAWNLDKIGDAIKEFSIRVIDGSDTTVVALRQLGFVETEIEQQIGAGGETAREAFLSILSAISELEDPFEQNLQGTRLFGTMWEDLGPEVIEQMTNITDSAVEMGGAMESLKETRYDNLQGSLGELSRTFQDLAVGFGELLIPKVESLTNFLTSMGEKFDALSPSTKQAIIDFGLFAAAIGPVALVIGKVFTLFSTLGPVIAALAGPIGIIAAVVAALGVAWATNFNGMRETVSGFMTQIGEIIGSGLALVKAIWDNNFFGIKDTVTWVMELISITIETLLNGIQGFIDMFMGLVTGDWDLFWNGLWTTVSSVLSGIFLALASTVDQLIKVITNAVTPMLNAGKKLFTALWDGIKQIWEDISGWVEEKVNWIISKVKFWEDENDKMDTRDVERNYPTGGGSGGGARSVEGYYSSGLTYVPHDNFRAVLHEGERVLTAQENRAYSKTDQGERNLNVNVKFTGTMPELVRVLKPEIEIEDEREGDEF